VNIKALPSRKTILAVTTSPEASMSERMPGVSVASTERPNITPRTPPIAVLAMRNRGTACGSHVAMIVANGSTAGLTLARSKRCGRNRALPHNSPDHERRSHQEEEQRQ